MLPDNNVKYNEKYPQFNEAALKALDTYYAWLMNATKNNYDIAFEILSPVSPISPYDVCQIKKWKEGGQRLIEEQYVELKGRNISIEKYYDCEIDAHKIRDLKTLAVSTDCKVFLAALYYPSNALAIWQIDPDEDYEVITKVGKDTTMGNNPKEVNKSMVKLYLKDARVYPFKK